MKSTTIFTDQNLKEEKLALSPDEYSAVVKEAYKEGVKDAIAENTSKKTSSERNSEEESRKEGQNEAVKTEAKSKEQTRHKLENIAERQDIEILRIKGVFPFDFFPDTLIIDTTKVTIVKKQMYATENIITIPLKDLADTHIQTALFLASLTISYMPQSSSPGMLQPEEEQIACLKREDAMRAKNILKGIMVAQSEDIDISKFSPEEVFHLLEKLGKSEGVA